MTTIAKLAVVATILGGFATAGAAGAQTVGGLPATGAPAPSRAQASGLVAPGLALPPMNPERGKQLFASKGCVVCHSINGVGGTDAPRLDASTMAPVMDPFDFFAKMWRGAVPMIAMQQGEIGHQIEFTGQDLADIVAFVHNRQVQKTFTKADIPAAIRKHLEGDSDQKGDGGTNGMMQGMGPGMMGGAGMGPQKMGPQPR